MKLSTLKAKVERNDFIHSAGKYTQLTYNYGSGYNLAGNSNQLIAVADPLGDLGQGDFKDVVNPSSYLLLVQRRRS